MQAVAHPSPSYSFTTILGLVGGIATDANAATGSVVSDVLIEYGLRLVGAAGLAAVGYLTKYYLDKWFDQNKNGGNQ